jgi:hypothetical protein
LSNIPGTVLGFFIKLLQAYLLDFLVDRDPVFIKIWVEVRFGTGKFVALKTKINLFRQADGVAAQTVSASV